MQNRTEFDNDALSSSSSCRRRPRPCPRAPTSSLPATGYDILVVGTDTILNQRLAKSLLQVTFDKVNTNSFPQTTVVVDDEDEHDNDDNASSRRSCNSSSFSVMRGAMSARHVRLSSSAATVAELLRTPKDREGKSILSAPAAQITNNHQQQPSQSQSSRVDYIVLTTILTDPSCLLKLRENARNIHRDYFMLNRVCVVAFRCDGWIGGDEGDGTNHSSGVREVDFASANRLLFNRSSYRLDATDGFHFDGKKKEKKKKRKRNSNDGNNSHELKDRKRSCNLGTGEDEIKGDLFPSGCHVPVFRCDELDDRSMSSVSRSILQSCKMSCRAIGSGCHGSSFGGGGVSPLFFSAMI
mmetsp:Transcript_40523/g.47430  ORF Transcript_40523/g.47430 Transcript_40523/m.47430 type:complete len:354 (+) Transcript_40523:80-1141(+)